MNIEGFELIFLSNHLSQRYAADTHIRSNDDFIFIK